MTPTAPPDRVLRELGRNRKQGRIAYRKFVNEGLNVKLGVPWADAAYGWLIWIRCLCRKDAKAVVQPRG